jgi:hypothetical protein
MAEKALLEEALGFRASQGLGQDGQGSQQEPLLELSLGKAFL